MNEFIRVGILALKTVYYLINYNESNGGSRTMILTKDANMKSTDKKRESLLGRARKLDGLLRCGIVVCMGAFLGEGMATSSPLVACCYIFRCQLLQKDRVPVGRAYQTESGFCEEMIATLVSEEIWTDKMYLRWGWIKNLEVVLIA